MTTNKAYAAKRCLVLAFGASICSLAIGCSTHRNTHVEGLQDELTILKRDPAVIAQASSELQDAEQAVIRAEAHWAETHNDDEAEHLCYLGSKRIDIARSKTDQLLAEYEFRRLGEARSQAGVDASHREAANANARANLADATAAQYESLAESRKSQIEMLKGELDDLAARESSRGLVLTLGDVVFQTNRADLKSGATRKLLPFVAFLRTHSADNVVIEGHTDNTGGSDSNLDLSNRRAQSVRDFLVREGISGERITTAGLGEQFPLAANETPAGRLLNRRVEMIVVSDSTRGSREARR